MDTPEPNERSASRTDFHSNPQPPPSFSRSGTVLSPQACATCQDAADSNTDVQNASPSYVYALGSVEARFPRVSLEKEFAQVA